MPNPDNKPSISDFRRLLLEHCLEDKSAPLESSSTVLWIKGNGVFDIDVNTAQGLKKFKNVREYKEVNHDLQSDSYESLTRRPQFYIPVRSQKRGWSVVDIGNSKVERAAENAIPRIRDAGDILPLLERANGPDLRRLIIDAEAMVFEGKNRMRLVVLLKMYIEQNRDNTDRNELIAVAAAIRKCVALLDLADMEWLATLLQAGHRVPTSLDTELEIAKMVYRRYSVSPPEQPEPHPELAACLADMASTYLGPRVFVRERFPTVAMLAIQALLVMGSAHTQSIIGQVNNLRYVWFRQQLRRRIERALVQMLPSDAQRSLAAMVQTIKLN